MASVALFLLYAKKPRWSTRRTLLTALPAARHRSQEHRYLYRRAACACHLFSAQRAVDRLLLAPRMAAGRLRGSAYRAAPRSRQQMDGCASGRDRCRESVTRASRRLQ